MNIFSKPRAENRIFRNEHALLPDYLPEELPGREREVRELVFCLQPASENRQPEHAILVGPPGTGKTSSARYVLKQLSDYSARPLAVYINCWETPSRFSVLSFLAAAIGEPMPRRGIAADEILARFFEIVKKEERIPIVVLDEADRLETSEDGVQVLYDLCRAGEMHSLLAGVIAITNDPEFHIRLDARVRSSFVQHTLEFAPYSVQQMKEIAGRRAKMAFADGALDPDVVPLCSAIAVKRGGDARVALALLHSAGKAAERENAAKVEVKHVRATEAQALQSSASKAERKIGDLDAIDQAIIGAIRTAGKNGMESGKLYSALEKTAGERAIRQRLEKLEKNGIVSTESVQFGKGRSRIIRVK
jgi:archaeal cell division control protein 6